MDTIKVAAEISRLINHSSRKMRENEKTPSSQELLGIAKLTSAYASLLQVEEEPEPGEDTITEDDLKKFGAGYECAQGLKPMPKVQRTPKGMRKRGRSHA